MQQGILAAFPTSFFEAAARVVAGGKFH